MGHSIEEIEYNAKRDAKIIELWKQGYGVSVLSLRYGITPRRIYGIIQEWKEKNNESPATKGIAKIRAERAALNV